MRLRAGADAVPREALPPVTVLVPARDEGERIGACLRSVLAQDYPDVRVVAVDDRSTDRTAAVIAEAAAADGRVTAVRIGAADLPAGWCGKNFALHTGVSHAAAADAERTAPWLAFVDADVVLDPHALRTAVALSVAKRYDVTSFLPRTERVSFFHDVAEPVFGAFVLGVYGAALTNHDGHRDVAFANGQFMLFRRSAYDAVGGHAAVAGRCCEDVALARRAKAMGYRVRLLLGPELATVRAFPSLPAALRGWGRILYVIDPGSPWRILGAAAFLLACCLSAYVVGGIALAGAIGGNPNALPWLAAAAGHLALLTLFVALVYRWSRLRAAFALCFPLAAGLVLAVFGVALANYARGGVVWRETRYAQGRPLGARLAGLLPSVAPGGRRHSVR